MLASARRHLQPHGEKRGREERGPDAGYAGCPAEPVEELPQRVMVGVGVLMLATSWVGWWLYQSGSTPDHFDVWIDEVALDSARIGCSL